MISRLGLLVAAAGLPCAPVPAGSPPFGLAAAARHLGIDPAEANGTPAVWNGEQVLFVDHLAGAADDAEREIWVLRRNGAGALQAARVTLAGQEGGDANVAAIGFANADRDPAQEAILILHWPVNHHDVGGDLYEVRLFDDWKRAQAGLVPLVALSRRFGSGCDCFFRDGPHKPFRFKTLAAVRKALIRLGY